MIKDGDEAAHKYIRNGITIEFDHLLLTSDKAILYHRSKGQVAQIRLSQAAMKREAFERYAI